MTRIIPAASVCVLALLAMAPPAAANDIPSRSLRLETYTAVPGAASDAATAAAQACRVFSTASEPELIDPRWLWRLRAYRHLDCIATLVDTALRPVTAAGRNDDRNVPVAREDLERIRTLAWWARDAAARIGQ